MEQFISPIRRKLVGLSGIAAALAYLGIRKLDNTANSQTSDDLVDSISARVIQAWDVTAELGHYDIETGEGATESEFALAQRQFGIPVPASMRDVYQVIDGGIYVDGHLMLEPLVSPRPDGSLTVVTSSDEYRASGWPIPDEFFIFGSDGSESMYGIWIDTEWTGEPPIIETAEAEDMFHVVSDDFAQFMLWRTAFSLLVHQGDAALVDQGLDALGVPDSLRKDPFADEDSYRELVNWANPHLDRWAPVHEEWVPAHELRAFIRSAA